MASGLYAKNRSFTRYGQKSEPAKLNLVSLMDIFTILVFFLMFNSSDVQVLQQNKNITLPDSSAKTQPEESIVIMLTQQDLIVQNELVGKLEDVVGESQTILPLKNILDRHDKRAPELAPEAQALGREVVVMGDSMVPYETLKKVLATCAETSYRQVSLAVSRVEKKSQSVSNDLAYQASEML